MTISTVSSVNQLYTALSQAQGGDIIQLAPGTYDKIGIWKGLGFDITFDSPVTIRSMDPDNPAVIGELAVRDAGNIVFDGLKFDYDAPVGKSVLDRPFEVTNSDSITIKNSVFEGDIAEGVDIRADGFGTGVGLSVRESSNMTVENNTFFDFYKAVGIGETTGVAFTGNDIHSVRADGLTMVKVVDALIEGNHIHDFKRNLDAGDHADMIQFWTNGTDFPSSNITIRHNLLDIGSGNHTQGIFMRNEAVDSQDGGLDMFYRNITIEDNLLINAHINSIVVGETDGLTINGNILLHSDGEVPRDVGHLENPRIRLSEDSTNVVLTNNVMSSMPGVVARNSEWIVADNTIAQSFNHEANGYYVSAEDFLAEYAPDRMDWLEVMSSKAYPEPVVGNADVPVPGFAYDFSTQYSADFASVLTMDNAVRGDVTYEGDITDGDAFVFDSETGVVVLGKLGDYRDTDEIVVDMKFTLNNSADTGHLFNNHMRLSAAAAEDELILRVATQNEGLKTYKVDDIDLGENTEHHLTVLLDREDDHLQVILNGQVVLEDMTTDFVARDGMHNWGWTLGHKWSDSVDGSVSDFNLSDEAHFTWDADALVFV
ncbi:right-handed parallel beta-helix repeat-containing protein [Roseobacter litoralis]|uniref:Right handed beta helix domain-containing protein n=1 Tax=Roseobacter litoralis (strain ATCC 49566 / DSM 6996 / JCM 21268 / NBRC 15278 / OCh 149) TaxID=391595 RepID=F7ZML1_ROSLO|nr:right-handed parallel beta-helix repeat-containing protein [Roseobacter litoralis]AEI96548.1 hypothetical protein RLO149_p630400 [Roseobacter litoralis Och 149]